MLMAPVALLISKVKLAPPANVVGPTVRVPGLAPGETVPPEPRRSGPLMVPVPPKVPPEPTVTGPEPVPEPVRLVTRSLPPVMLVGPE